MRILGWSKCLSLRERLKNEAIKKRAGLAKISDKIRETRLSCNGHVVWRGETSAIKSSWTEPVVGKRPRELKC